MDKAQHAILRFAKYKGPEISRIEAHNERTKESYASNPDVDTARSKQNFHLVTPERKYRARGGTADCPGWLPYPQRQRPGGGGPVYRQSRLLQRQK